jgi:uncharacterized membrane protein YdjX (TVP38/TMEM64 family)
LGLFFFILIVFAVAEYLGWLEQSTIKQHFSSLEELKYGLWIIAIICFLAYSLDVILPTPSSILMILSSHWIGPELAFLCAFLGLCLSSVLGYEICRSHGPQALKLDLENPQFIKTKSLIQKYGFWSILICRPIPIASEIFSCCAGLLKMKRNSYYFATFIGQFLYAISFTIGISDKG